VKRLVALVLVFLICGTQVVAAAPTNLIDCTTNKTACNEDLQSIDGDSIYYQPNQGGCSGATTASTTITSGTLPSIIPEPYNGAFTQAGTKHNVAPALIAALFSEENGLGNNSTNPDTVDLPQAWASFVQRHPDPNAGWPTSSANAEGPFQFLPSTFTGLGYNISDITNLVVAADAAAKYVASNGATTNVPVTGWQNAIFSYNHAQWYVNAVLQLYNYYSGLPQTTGTGTGATTITAASSPTGCTCNNSSAPVTGSTSATLTAHPGAPVIAIDPGHAPEPATASIDTQKQINLTDWENDPEMSDMYAAAQAISQQLVQAGYNTLITKNSLTDYVNLEQREVIAEQASAVLGVSLHSSPGSAQSVNQVYYPANGEYRILTTGAHSAPYNNSTLAATDQKDAAIMALARGTAENQPVNSETYAQQLGGESAPPRIENTLGVPQGGNILEADYFASIPWVYNEQWQDGGRDPGGVDPQTHTQESGSHVAASTLTAYENGVVKGVEQIAPLSTGAAAAPASSSGCNASITCPANGSAAAQSTPVGKLLCAAEQWAGKAYVFGGGHESAALFMQHFAAGQYDGLDCSSLVGVAVYTAFGVDDVRVSGGYASSPNWKVVPIEQAQPGDVLANAGHIEFIVQNKGGGNFYDFGAHQSGVPLPQQISFDTLNIADFPDYAADGVQALRYIGPGSGGT
jgi:N-acetylmuramoyl-L-alanine amidase